jgi:hemoglobin
MPADAVNSIYDIIGADGIARITAAFYHLVRSDDILRPIYPEADLAGSEARLRGFSPCNFRFGGPPRYVEQRGDPRLRQRHAPFPIDQHARDRWVALMEQALEQAAIPPPVTDIMRQFFQEVASFLINRPMPRELS